MGAGRRIWHRLRRRFGLLTALALCALSGVPCGAVEDRLIRAGKFRIAQAQDRADGYRARLLQRFGLTRLDRFELAAGGGGASLELPLALRRETSGGWQLGLRPTVGVALRRGGQRQYAGTARLRVRLDGPVWSEGQARPGLRLSLRAGLSGKDVALAPGKAIYAGRLMLTKHIGAWTVRGSGRARSVQRLHGWQHVSAGRELDGSLSAAWQSGTQFELLMALSGARSVGSTGQDRHALAIGAGMAVHPQAFVSLLLRYRSNGTMQVQPGVTISL